MAKKKQQCTDDDEISDIGNIGSVVPLTDRAPTATEKRKIRKKQPIGFVHFEDKE